MPLVVFSEGNLNHICGYYRKIPGTEEIVFCRDAEMTARRIVVADPFNAQSPDVSATIQQLGLQYRGQEVTDGTSYDMISVPKNDHSASTERQWWIDRHNYLLAKTVTHQSNGTKVVSRFSYDHINEALSFMAYMPDISYQWVCAHKQMVDPVEDGDSSRFIEVCDGTSGNVCGTWGCDGDTAKNVVGITGPEDTRQVSKAHH
jgi:hypothetical protein